MIIDHDHKHHDPGGGQRLSSCVHNQLWRRGGGERRGEEQEDGEVAPPHLLHHFHFHCHGHRHHLHRVKVCVEEQPKEAAISTT